MQTKSIIQFNGTEEQLQAGCIGNGYTGFVNNGIMPNSEEPVPQTINEFLSIILKTVSPYQFITNATFYWEKRLGVDNYNRAEMEQAMKKALTINVITE
jgi:hypothetical protein